MRNFSTNYDASGIQNIILSGMGGSAISGDILLGYAADELKVPAIVNRDYSTPGFVNENTLFIAISYSGNTEETLRRHAGCYGKIGKDNRDFFRWKS